MDEQISKYQRTYLSLPCFLFFSQKTSACTATVCSSRIYLPTRKMMTLLCSSFLLVHRSECTLKRSLQSKHPTRAKASVPSNKRQWLC